MERLGAWAFLIGVILAIVFGAFGMNNTVAIILVVLGIIVGLLNVTQKEASPFLMAGAVLVIVSALGSNVLNIIPAIGGIFNAMVALFAPATVVVALRSVFTMAKKK